MVRMEQEISQSVLVGAGLTEHGNMIADCAKADVEAA